LAVLPFVAVAGLIGALGWWSLAVVVALVFLVGCWLYWHKREHLPGIPVPATAAACKRWHAARYVQLKSDETELRHQDDYERGMVAEEDAVAAEEP
jgi:hypothetical protein